MSNSNERKEILLECIAVIVMKYEREYNKSIIDEDKKGILKGLLMARDEIEELIKKG